jgi:hypothetical protein
VFNLHRDGILKFYSTGNDAVKIYTDDGLIYLIGTQKADELYRLLNEKLKKHEG